MMETGIGIGGGGDDDVFLLMIEHSPFLVFPFSFLFLHFLYLLLDDTKHGNEIGNDDGYEHACFS